MWIYFCREDIELSESLPLGNEDSTWTCQCRDHSWCLTTLLKWLNYIPISRKYEMSYSYLNKGIVEFALLTTERNKLVNALSSWQHTSFFVWSCTGSQCCSSFRPEELRCLLSVVSVGFGHLISWWSWSIVSPQTNAHALLFSPISLSSVKTSGSVAGEGGTPAERPMWRGPTRLIWDLCWGS